MLLAIDTATRNASIALYNEEGVQAEMTWRSRENHTVELMMQIVRVLELARVDKSELKAVGVALGPGSFTGLRVGMSVAKGLAFGAHAPLLGIPTLDALAAGHALQPLPMWVVLAAGRGRYSTARYAARHGVIERTSDYALVNAAGLADLASAQNDGAGASSDKMLFSGEIDKALGKLLSERLGERAVITSPAMSLRRAGYLAELAWARFTRGEADDTASLAPMYAPHEI